MQRSQVLRLVFEKLATFKESNPLLVGIDGIDGAGKTTFADELSEYIEKAGYRSIRASIDSFHNPREMRLARGDPYRQMAITRIPLTIAF